ncbi:hypothetical protein BN77_p10299 [Rhizobium mesoamericanum STM3625]|uniref:Transmembrane protein n=1 Tax=Rhizobium mesoamericanum STM3625 TaxID=1211777 RepID=K0PQZ1_9HYPH|nr:hypothetical protein BN77_p10299 [Rhizobium mesoamericanum STM3625]
MSGLLNSDCAQGVAAFFVVIVLAFSALYFGYGVHRAIDGPDEPFGYAPKKTPAKHI